MHKKKQIKKDKKSGNALLSFQFGGQAPNFASLKQPMASLGQGLSMGSPNLTPFTPTLANPNPPKGEFMNTALTAGLTGLFNTSLAVGNIKNSGMNEDQKKIAYGDAGVDAISNVASMFGPMGSMIGGGLKTLNSIGGMMIKTPSTLKNFTVNDQIASSSGFTGAADAATNMANSATSFKNAGLAGKLFGGKKNLVNKANLSNQTQTQVADILDNNQLAKDSAATSSSMFSSKNNNKLYNSSMFNNGSVMMGQAGGVLNSHSNRNYADLLWGSNGEKVNKFISLAETAKKVPVKRMVKEWLPNLKKPEAVSITDPVPVPTIPAAADGTIQGGMMPEVAVTAEAIPMQNYRLYPQGQMTHEDMVYLRSLNNQQLNQSLDNVISNPNETPLYGTRESDMFKHFLSKRPKQNLVATHKEGGPVNIIVDGELHARKHDIKETEEFKDANITHKGIPVVTKEEGGEIVQHAEVEKDELILHYDLSKELESFLDDDSEEALIRAGKLLAQEIVKNTKDSKSKIIKNS